MIHTLSFPTPRVAEKHEMCWVVDREHMDFSRLPGRRVCVVALSVVADDPRVVRQCRALAEAGAEVHVLGYEGGAVGYSGEVRPNGG